MSRALHLWMRGCKYVLLAKRYECRYGSCQQPKPWPRCVAEALPVARMWVAPIWWAAHSAACPAASGDAPGLGPSATISSPKHEHPPTCKNNHPYKSIYIKIYIYIYTLYARIIYTYIQLVQGHPLASQAHITHPPPRLQPGCRSASLSPFKEALQVPF